MSIPVFKKLVSPAVPVAADNIDTDQIIPARFLKAVERKGFGDNLFYDWRYDKQGAPVAGFALNRPEYSGRILLGGDNFGCGSSREHAAWAIFDYGFRAVVSSSFADIFRNNALNIGLLPVRIGKEALAEAFRTIEADPKAEFEIDLENRRFTNLATGRSESFDIDAYKRKCLMNGFDDVDYLCSIADRIEEFEASRKQSL